MWSTAPRVLLLLPHPLRSLATELQAVAAAPIRIEDCCLRIVFMLFHVLFVVVVSGNRVSSGNRGKAKRVANYSRIFSSLWIVLH